MHLCRAARTDKHLLQQHIGQLSSAKINSALSEILGGTSGQGRQEKAVQLTRKIHPGLQRGPSSTRGAP